MRKVFKKCVAIALAAAMVFSSNVIGTTKVASADEATEVVADVANPTTKQVITGTAWWAPDRQDSAPYYVAPNQSTTVYFRSLNGNVGSCFETHVPVEGVEQYITLNLEGKDSWGGLQTNRNDKVTAKAIVAGGNYKVTVTRNDEDTNSILNLKVVNAEDEEDVYYDIDYTLAANIQDVLPFYFMAQVGSFEVSPYKVATKSEKLVGTGWWDGPNGVSSNYYVGPNETTEFVFQHIDGFTGVVLESNYAGAYLDTNLQDAESGSWGALIAEGGYNRTAGKAIAANGSYKATITRNDEGDVTVVTAKIVNLNDETDVVLDATYNLTEKIPTYIPFYLLATDATILVGPNVDSLGQDVDMINSGKAAIKDGKINLSFKTTDVAYDDLSITLGDEVVATAADLTINEETGVATFAYDITEEKEYSFKVVAKKNADDAGFYKDDIEKISISVVKDGDKVYIKDNSLSADPTISEDNGSYVVSWTAEEDVTYNLVVTDSTGKAVEAKKTETGKATFSGLAEGTYKVVLTAVDGEYANKGENEFSVQKAAEASATSKFAQITTKPIFSYEFNSATENGLKLTNASIKKVTRDNKSESVLQLGDTKDLSLVHKSYATIPSLSSKDFSNGITVTFDVNVNGAYTGENLNGWTKFFGFGNGVVGRDPVNGEFAYGFTLGLNHVVDNNDWNHKSGYYGTGTGVLDGVDTEGAAPLGTTTNPMVWNWYTDSSKQNRWDNITVTVAKDGTMSTYYDGVLVQSYKQAAFATEILGGMKKATNNILGGSYYPDPDLVAMMDNFAVYNTALSAADIKTLAGDIKADSKAVEALPDPNNKSGEVTAISFTDYEISSNRKTLEVYFSAKPDKVVAVNNKGTKVKKITLGRTTKITFKSAMKVGSKVKVTATKDGKSVSKTYTVKGTIKISKVKAKKNTKKVTGKLNIKKATVKVKVKYKGKKKYTKYKKAKVSGKKFTFKTKKLKKGSKVVIKVTKKNYKTKTKTVKVK